jgi:hypothetical protein
LGSNGGRYFECDKRVQDRKTYLDPPVLLVDIMVGGIIIGKDLKRVVGKTEAAVVVDGLERCQGEKYGSLANVKAGELVGQDRVNGVFDKSFERVIVQRSKGVRDVESVVARVGHACP